MPLRLRPRPTSPSSNEHLARAIHDAVGAIFAPLERKIQNIERRRRVAGVKP
jgi:hypothetical protein